MNTYINDRKLEDYPFYNVGKTPFPPGCIKYLGVCLEDDASYPVYASAITISMDGVLVSLCRKTGEDSTETIGSVYATASAGSASSELSGGSVKGSVSLLIDKTMLQNAYGNYTGEFYLDPVCVTYVSSGISGQVRNVVINGSTFAADKSLNFSSTGDLLTLQRLPDSTNESVTAMLTGSTAIDSYSLVEDEQIFGTFVESINNLSPSAIPASVDPEPALHILSGSDSIWFGVLKGGTDDPALVIEVVGTSAFPNCYGTDDEAQNEPIQEPADADDNEQS